jgi:hypothetical protein
MKGTPGRGKDAERTFLSQGTCVLPVDGRPGAFIFMADRWNPENLSDSRYVWLPFRVNGEDVAISWQESWDLSAFETMPLVYEDFEGGWLPRVPWPRVGGWMIPVQGQFKLKATIDPEVRGGGKYSLRLDYDMDERGYILMSHLHYPNMAWSRYNALRFWLKPDNSRRIFAYGVLDTDTKGGGKTFWEGQTILSGTAPRIVTIPFKDFVPSPWGDPVQTPHVDTSGIVEVVFWIRAGEGGTGPGTIWVDAFELVKLPSATKASQ